MNQPAFEMLNDLKGNSVNWNFNHLILETIDISGKVVFSQKIVDPASGVMKIENIPSGIFRLQIPDGADKFSQKLMLSNQ